MTESASIREGQERQVHSAGTANSAEDRSREAKKRPAFDWELSARIRPVWRR